MPGFGFYCFTHLVTFAQHKGSRPHFTHALKDSSERTDFPKLHSKEAFLTTGFEGGNSPRSNPLYILQNYLACLSRYF